MKADKLIAAVEGVTARWTKQRKREERDRSALANRRLAMTRARNISIRDAAFQVMQEAYLRASARDTLPALARQIMYAARPKIQALATRELGSKFDQYFIQKLLPDYMEDHRVDWNVVFDARGNFTEPHTEKNVPLGTLDVRDYLAQINGHTVEPPDFDIQEKYYPTIGADHRFGAILSIEKEGFLPLHLAERYDLAIMSTKGMSSTAARLLVDRLCRGGVPLLVLHDFDKAGFSIAGTLRRSTRRYRFSHSHAPNVIDLGLRLEDVDGLESEDVHLGNWDAAATNLRLNGATPEEIEFLLERRVELNAFASDELIEWLEGKLTEHGVQKVVPDQATLAEAYRRMRRQAIVQEKINELIAGLGAAEMPVPENLADQIRDALENEPTLSWDDALRTIAEDAAP
jgi:Protein of unknown function C-terminus (DUF2399)